MIRRHLSPAVLCVLVLIALLLPRGPASPPPWVPIALCAGASSLSIVAFHCGGRRTGRLAVQAAGIAAGALLAHPGLVRMAWDRQSAGLSLPLGAVTEVRGVLAADSSLSRKGDTILSLSLRGAGSSTRSITATARGRMLVVLSGNYPFAAGTVLSVRCLPRASDADGPESWLSYATRFDVETEGFAGAFWAARSAVRLAAARALSLAGYPASALLEALLIGAREDVTPELEEGFLRSGSLHILALSGMHAGILAGLVSALLFFVPWKTVRFLVSAALLCLFQLLAGWLPSLLRATSMFLVAGIAALLDRDMEPMNLLALSALPILMINPYDARSMSFQLSYLALSGIFLVSPLVERPLLGRVPGFLSSPVSLSLGALAATTPLLLGLTGAFYPSGIAAGLLLVPLTTVFLWAGLAFLAAAAVGWGGLMAVLSEVLSRLYDATAACARFFASFPYLDLKGSDMALTAVAATGLAALGIALFLPIRFRNGDRP